MVADPWEHVEAVADRDRYARLAASGPYDLPISFREWLTACRPAWHARAACRGRGELSWLDKDQTTSAAAVCLSCPVRDPCGEAGRRERWGTWGGVWRTRPGGRHPT